MKKSLFIISMLVMGLVSQSFTAQATQNTKITIKKDFKRTIPNLKQEDTNGDGGWNVLSNIINDDPEENIRPDYLLPKKDLHEFILSLKMCKPRPECTDDLVIIKTESGYSLLKAEIKADAFIVKELKLPDFLKAEINQIFGTLGIRFVMASIRFDRDGIRFENFKTDTQLKAEITILQPGS